MEYALSMFRQRNVVLVIKDEVFIKFKNSKLSQSPLDFKFHKYYVSYICSTGLLC
jgi:hypothetical protein